MRLEVAQALVRARCYGRCEGCGGYGDVQVHHRRARGVGGTFREAQAIVNSPANMLALDPTCHQLTEDAATWRDCLAKGWRVSHWGVDLPAAVPALIHTVQGYGWWWLLDSGGYRWANLADEYRLVIEESEESE